MKMSSGVKNAPMCSAIIRNRVVETLSIQGEIRNATILSVVWKRSLKGRSKSAYPLAKGRFFPTRRAFLTHYSLLMIFFHNL